MSLRAVDDNSSPCELMQLPQALTTGGRSLDFQKHLVSSQTKIEGKMFLNICFSSNKGGEIFEN